MWSVLIIFSCKMDFNTFTATGSWSHRGYNAVSICCCQDALSAARNCGRRIFCVYVWILTNPRFTSKNLCIGSQQFCIMKLKNVIEYKTRSSATAKMACIWHCSIMAHCTNACNFDKFRLWNSTVLPLFHNSFLIENDNNDWCTKNVYSHHMKTERKRSNWWT